MIRSRALDVLTGLAGLGICAAALLLQNVSRPALEYALIVLPVVVFSALTWLRIRAGSPPRFAFAAVNIWLITAEFALANLALTTIGARSRPESPPRRS